MGGPTDEGPAPSTILANATSALATKPSASEERRVVPNSARIAAYTCYSFPACPFASDPGQGVTDLRQRKSEWGANIPLRGLQRPDAWGCPTSDAGPACSPRSPAAPIRQRLLDRRATNRGTRGTEARCP